MALGDCAPHRAAPDAHEETSRQLLISLSPLQDIKRCLNALEELGTLQVTSHILQKHTDVVATLKKVGQRDQSLLQGARSLRGPPRPPDRPSSLFLAQIRRYKANKDVMEKAAEVYTRLKSRVLGPKLEAIQKANKAGTEKDKGEAEKGQEKLAGGETRNEKGEEETNAGNIPCASQGCSWGLGTQTGTQRIPLGMQTGMALGLGGSGDCQPHVSPPVLFYGARRGKGRDGERWRHWEQRANRTLTLGASGLVFGPAAPLPARALPRGAAGMRSHPGPPAPALGRRW